MARRRLWLCHQSLCYRQRWNAVGADFTNSRNAANRVGWATAARVLMAVSSFMLRQCPALMILAGVHGDEYEGQISVANPARTLGAPDIRGRVILPLADYAVNLLNAWVFNGVGVTRPRTPVAPADRAIRRMPPGTA
ncbi:succinylglutamate desuccinylase/aspartoacylase family protein [Yoonia sediminilitoris]|uniref:Succinylglutamate desuccinylase/aspartoacylase family protein n=1 Tax=Yoonia sediminilitoris TaxID=1286148 RepID=A0A2T6KPD8_9RHOB|nr:succinylglutamate desuccinylase/aspartoacylase family protein [Yoonia sediminilitoris]PUB18433.1 succinylglutamate desuccinylase/aspartoacylase family protein [Yoonia sediminilitoris]RCW98601.1 succinylglutamate desuccinylase/aspartoacylase family protein [Yoonia sediminilitoris]